MYANELWGIIYVYGLIRDHIQGFTVGIGAYCLKFGYDRFG